MKEILKSYLFYKTVLIVLFVFCFLGQGYSQYCNPTFRGIYKENYIRRVQIGEVNEDWDKHHLFSDTRNGGAYNDFSNQQVHIYKERAFDIKIWPSNTWTFERHHAMSIYIDWNNNFSFDDPGEEIFMKEPDEFPFQVRITAPDDAPLGEHRIRIKYHAHNLHYYTYKDSSRYACDNPNGEMNVEAEDYTLVLNPKVSYPPGKDISCYNAGFETGSFDNWAGFLGCHANIYNARYDDDNYTFHPCVKDTLFIKKGCCTVNEIRDQPATIAANTPTGEQHLIVTQGIDPETNILQMVPPDGGNFAVRLGNSIPYFEASRLQTTFTVTADAPNFAYSFAMVMNDPGHVKHEQPYFKAAAYDQKGLLIPCSSRNFTSGYGDNVWSEFGNGVYRDWEKFYINLDQYIGTDVTIKFSVADCCHGQHFGYAYIDSQCEPLEIVETNNDVCQGGDLTLSIPLLPDRFTFNWSTGDTTPTITIVPESDTTIITLNVIPPSGCPIQLHDTIFLLNQFGISEPTFECDEENETFRVSFEFSGDSTIDYTILGDYTGTVTNNGTVRFVSEPIPSSIGITRFTISDTSKCAPEEIEIFTECPYNCKVEPVLDAGANAEICFAENIPFQLLNASAVDLEDSLSLLAPSKAGISWYTNGTGNFTDTNTLSPNYIPSIIDTMQTISFWMVGYTGEDQYLCPNDTVEVQLIVQAPPTVQLPSDSTLCLSDINLGIAEESYVSTYQWKHNGNGNLLNETSSTPIYSPDTSDYDQSIQFNLIVEGHTTCPVMEDSMILTFLPKTKVEAGDNGTICEDSIFTIKNSSASNYDRLIWTHNGSGTLDTSNALTPIYSPDESDAGKTVLFYLEAAVDSPCTGAIDSLTLQILSLPKLLLQSDSLFCNTSTWTPSLVDTSFVSSYYWTHSGLGNFTDSSLLFPVYEPFPTEAPSTINFILHAFGIGTCSSIKDTLVSTIVPLPLLELNKDDTICSTELFDISYLENQYTSKVDWTFDGFGELTEQSNGSYQYTPSIQDTSALVTISIEGFPLQGCSQSDTASINLKVIAPPIVETPIIESICENAEEFTLSASKTFNSSTYQWNVIGNPLGELTTSSLSPSYQPVIGDGNKQLLFELIGTPISPCTELAKDTFLLNINEVPVFDPIQLAICPNASLLLEVPISGTNQLIDLDWYSDRELTDLLATDSLYQTPSLTKNTTYFVVPSRGCKGDAVPIEIKIHPEPIADFSFDVKEIIAVDSWVVFSNESSGTLLNHWDFGDNSFETVSSTDSLSHLYSFVYGSIPNSLPVQLTTENEFGCKDTIFKTIPVNVRWAFYVPNAFSPNKDYINDSFKWKGFGITEVKWSIFNRWGDEIFYTEDLNDSWDGTDHQYDMGTLLYRSETVKVETYVYKFEFINIFGESHKYLGKVNLIR